jgi:hypothetical protein
MCPSKTRPMGRLIAAAVATAAIGSMLGGCSDLYTDRRDTIALAGGDAVAANQVKQMNDPWPPHSGNTSVAFNGQRMQSAVERYRTNNVTPPVDPQNSVGSTVTTTQVAPPASITAPATSIASGTTTTTTTVVSEPSGSTTQSSSTH